jgi:hypothetical protein
MTWDPSGRQYFRDDPAIPPDNRCYHRSAALHENSRLYVFSQTVEPPLPGVIKRNRGQLGIAAAV